MTNSVFQLGMRNVQAPKQQQTSKNRKFKRNYANCEKILFLSQLPTVSSNIRLDGSKYIVESLDFYLNRPTFRISEAL